MAEPEERSEDEQELLRSLEEQLEQLKIADVLVQSALTVSQLGWRRLGSEHRDLGEARLAVDSLKALTAVLEGALPAETHRDLSQMVANMQLAFAKASAESGAPGPPEPEARPDSEPDPAAGD
ncbi:MAG: hypothetical protein ABR521_11565 [Gaiellaceae bacterium]